MLHKSNIDSSSLSQVPTPVGGTFPKPTAMKTTKAIMCLNKDAAKEPSEIYDILMTDGLIGLEANELVQKILRDRDNITKKDLISAEAIGQNDIWREQQAVERYTEGRMIRRSMLRDRAVVLALNVPGMRPIFHPLASSRISPQQKWLLTVPRKRLQLCERL